MQQSLKAEWFEDKEEVLRELFNVTGYPTLFVIGNDGKIQKVISGVSDELKAVSFVNQKM
jgi:hypothetical protein